MSADDLTTALADPRLPRPMADLMADFASRGTDPAHLVDLVTAYLAHPEWEQDFDRALTSADHSDDAADVAVSLLTGGADREQLTHWLGAHRFHLMSEDRDEEDDLVLEVLDRLTGFANPHQRI